MKNVRNCLSVMLAFVLAVVEMLAKLSDERLYDFMVNRFLDFMTIEAAANEVGFSYSWGRLAVERGVAEVQQKNRHRTIGVFHDGHLRLAEDRGRKRRKRAFCS